MQSHMQVISRNRGQIYTIENQLLFINIIYYYSHVISSDLTYIHSHTHTHTHTHTHIYMSKYESSVTQSYMILCDPIRM